MAWRTRLVAFDLRRHARTKQPTRRRRASAARLQRRRHSMHGSAGSHAGGGGGSGAPLLSTTWCGQAIIKTRGGGAAAAPSATQPRRSRRHTHAITTPPAAPLAFVRLWTWGGAAAGNEMGGTTHTHARDVSRWVGDAAGGTGRRGLAQTRPKQPKPASCDGSRTTTTDTQPQPTALETQQGANHTAFSVLQAAGRRPQRAQHGTTPAPARLSFPSWYNLLPSSASHHHRRRRQRSVAAGSGVYQAHTQVTRSAPHQSTWGRDRGSLGTAGGVPVAASTSTHNASKPSTSTSAAAPTQRHAGLLAVGQSDSGTTATAHHHAATRHGYSYGGVMVHARMARIKMSRSFIFCAVIWSWTAAACVLGRGAKLDDCDTWRQALLSWR